MVANIFIDGEYQEFHFRVTKSKDNRCTLSMSKFDMQEHTFDCIQINLTSEDLGELIIELKSIKQKIERVEENG